MDTRRERKQDHESDEGREVVRRTRSASSLLARHRRTLRRCIWWVALAALGAALYLPVEPWVLIRVGVLLEPLYRVRYQRGPFEWRLGCIGGRAAPAVLDYVMEYGMTGKNTQFLSRVLSEIGDPARAELAARVERATRDLVQSPSAGLVPKRLAMNRLLVRRWHDVRYLNLLVEDAVTLRATGTQTRWAFDQVDDHGPNDESAPDLIGSDGRLSRDFAAYYAQHTAPKGRFPPLRPSWLRTQVTRPPDSSELRR